VPGRALGHQPELTIDQWVARVTAGSEHEGRRIDHTEISNHDLVEVTRTEFNRDSPGLPTEHNIAYFFKLRGRVFEVALRYILGDPNAARHERALQEVLGTLREG